MILILRVAGKAAIKSSIEETLRRLNIHRKLACTLISREDEVKCGMLRLVRDYVAYSEVSDDLAKEIIAKRGQSIDGKPVKDSAKALDSIKKGKWTIKKFFRLHPPRGGFKKSTKLHAPKGVLGENKDLDKLILRML
jgi:large subunit ribosomal protein L30